MRDGEFAEEFGFHPKGRRILSKTVTSDLPFGKIMVVGLQGLRAGNER